MASDNFALVSDWMFQPARSKANTSKRLIYIIFAPSFVISPCCRCSHAMSQMATRRPTVDTPAVHPVEGESCTIELLQWTVQSAVVPIVERYPLGTEDLPD